MEERAVTLREDRKMMPRVSVVIPVYNSDKYLEKCLRSVLDQSIREIEIICVDDGSTDESIIILRKMANEDERIKIIQQENQFAGVARNTGLKNAVGEYVYFLDSDDYCDRKLLEFAINKAEETSADIVCFDHYVYDEKTEIKEIKRDVDFSIIKKSKNWFNYRNCPSRIMSIVNPVPWNKLYNKQFLDEWNLQFENLSTTNDITFAALSVACAKRITYINSPLITHRINVKSSITSKKKHNISNVLLACTRLYKKALSLPHYHLIEESVQRFVASNVKFAEENYIQDIDEKAEEFLCESEKMFSNLPLFFFFDKLRSSAPELYGYVQKKQTKRELLPYGFDIVVSLTSYSKRITTVSRTVRSLFDQNVIPNKIVLYLSETDFPNGFLDLPEDLNCLRGDLFEVRWTRDTKSYKKLVPALSDFEGEIIITVDDDLIFDNDMIQKLLEGYRRYPECIQCHRITGIEYRSMLDYRAVPESGLVYPKPSFLHKLCGGAGCLYPPYSLFPDVYDEEKFMRLAPTSDDIWFWLMGVLNGTKVNLIKNAKSRLEYVPMTQGSALCLLNDGNEGYFKDHFESILCEYPVLDELLKYENNTYTLEMQITHIEQSVSYRIGRRITAVPRAVRRFSNSCKKHGVLLAIKYNVFRYIQKKGKNVKKDYEYYCKLPKRKYKKELVEWYERATNQPIDLENPCTFNEKIQWLKLYDTTKEKTKLSDKYAVRNWIKETIGEKYLVPCIGVYKSVKEIDFENLPSRFVMKATHGSAWNIIVRNKREINSDDIESKFDKWLNRNFAFHYGLELQYKGIKPQIIVEEYISQLDGGLFDYKVHCFNGEPLYIQVIGDRDPITHTFWSNVYDFDWNLMWWSIGEFQKSPYVISKPTKLDKLYELSKKLSKTFKYVRTDFYIINDDILFGEMTFTPGSGFYKYGSRWNREIDLMLGNKISLR